MVAPSIRSMSVPPVRFPTSPSHQSIKSCFSTLLRRADFDDYRVYSPWHEIHGYKWRLLIFPKGNRIDGDDIADMSVYLDCGGPIEPLPEKKKDKEQPASNDNDDNNSDSSTDEAAWNRYASFGLHLMKAKLLNEKLDGSAELAKLAVLEERAPPLTMTHSTGSLESIFNDEMCGICKDSSHNFTERVSDWGFLEFVSLSTLEEGPYTDPDGDIVIMVDISFRNKDRGVRNCVGFEEWHRGWESKVQTGYLGLTNSGSTGYLNATVQVLFSVGAIRSAVYHLSQLSRTPANKREGIANVTNALRLLFSELERSKERSKYSPSTKSLTRALGWDRDNAKKPFDIHELKVCLLGAVIDETVQWAQGSLNEFSTLFEGTLENVTNCVNMDYQSISEETFYDLWLNVRGCANIYESFEQYIEVERMLGTNKYHADGTNGLQEATKYVKFKKLPSVLQLFLRRSRYDFSRSTAVKVNDRYEFGKEIDLSRFVESSDGSEVFVLQSVVVFEDGLESSGGTYHAFILTNKGDEEPSQWLRFENEAITLSCEAAAIEGNFGVGGERDSNAYMVQYIRKSELGELLTAESYCVESSAGSEGDDQSQASSINEGGHQSPATSEGGDGSPAGSEAGDQNPAPSEGSLESPEVNETTGASDVDIIEDGGEDGTTTEALEDRAIASAAESDADENGPIVAPIDDESLLEAQKAYTVEGNAEAPSITDLPEDSAD